MFNFLCISSNNIFYLIIIFFMMPEALDTLML